MLSLICCYKSCIKPTGADLDTRNHVSCPESVIGRCPQRSESRQAVEQHERSVHRKQDGQQPARHRLNVVRPAAGSTDMSYRCTPASVQPVGALSGRPRLRIVAGRIAVFHIGGTTLGCDICGEETAFRTQHAGSRIYEQHQQVSDSDCGSEVCSHCAYSLGQVRCQAWLRRSLASTGSLTYAAGP